MIAVCETHAKHAFQKTDMKNEEWLISKRLEMETKQPQNI